MRTPGYYMLYAFVWLVSRLPLRILYLKSDFIYFLNFYIVGYRKKLVIKNLSKAFPEKSTKELHHIARSFFRHLSDYIVESVYLLRMKEDEARRRIHFKNLFLLDELYRQGKSIMMVFPHYANWEWLACLENASPYHVLAIYKPQQSASIDRLFIQLRQKFGLEVVPMNKTVRRILKATENREQIITLSLYDQRPLWNDLKHWITFLNREIPVLLGAEKIARKTGQVMVFIKTVKVKRGFYEVEFIQLTDNISKEPEDAVTNRFWKMLERMIREEPRYWLWSHDRWKFRQPYGYH